MISAILRFDPRSPSVSKGTKGLGDYTIPPANRFAADGDPKTLGEIYAYGFRNAHRLSWDLTDGTMFASDIGMNNIEEVNIVRNGENYGWMKREGYFENGMTRPGGALESAVRAAGRRAGRDARRTASPIRWPSTTTTTGRRCAAGFAYYGRIPALRGKFVFGDVARGRLFAADIAAMKKADDGVPQTVAPVEEIQLYVRDASGSRVYVSFRELIERTMGDDADARRPAHRPQPRRRALRHVAAGRHDPDARSRLEGCGLGVGEPAAIAAVAGDNQPQSLRDSEKPQKQDQGSQKNNHVTLISELA